MSSVATCSDIRIQIRLPTPFTLKYRPLVKLRITISPSRSRQTTFSRILMFIILNAREYTSDYYASNSIANSETSRPLSQGNGMRRGFARPRDRGDSLRAFLPDYRDSNYGGFLLAR